MPEEPDKKRRRLPPNPTYSPHKVGYAELNCKTNFSFLRGASHPDEVVYRATELGYRALAITDHRSLAGVVRAHSAAKETGLKLLIGSEISPQDAPKVVLLATDRQAYGRLSRLLTLGKRKAPKGECHLTFDEIASHAEGLIACTAPGSIGELGRYREVFGDRCYLLAHVLYGTDDQYQLEKQKQLSKQTNIPLVASNDVYFHSPALRPLADVLTAIREGCTVAEAGDLLLPNSERHLKSPDEMRELFIDCPDAIHRTVEIADRCHFSLDELKYEYPTELSPPGMTALEYLKQLAWEGAAWRYPNGITPKVESLIVKELALIEALRYEAYFLTVKDLVEFAKSRDILCQGRGSSANSVVCYCLGITAVSPERMDVLFERFMSLERNEPPDIDVDFEHERREEVLQYIFDKYGRDHSAMTAEVITYRPRSAIRDIGKALGFSLDKVDALAKTFGRDHVDVLERCRMAGINPKARLTRQLFMFLKLLLGFPRHLGQHVGGMVMTRGPLCELVPIENATMQDRTIIEWNKDDLDEIGILKVDCLALGMLTAVHKCFDLVERHHGEVIDMSVTEDDEAVYDMICKADTIGVFQIESRAQMSMLPRLRPRNFYDLVVEIAIVRPGPIQGDMVHPYLKRREQKELGIPEDFYPNDEIRKVLENTLGIPLFQEQAMKLAIVAAGFTPGEADELRRAMASWRATGTIDKFHAKLIAGMQANGYSEQFAEQIFKQINGFGSYGFPESHAAGFALIAYVSAYLKHRFPAAFCVALLNSQPMGFYAPAQLVWDARQHGVEVRPVDVNLSNWESTIEDTAIRLGMHMISGLRHLEAEHIQANRSSGLYRSMDDFTRRSGVAPATLARLARADAFGSLKLDRRNSLWQTLKQEKSPKARPLLDDLDDEETFVELPAMMGHDEVSADYRFIGLSLKSHPIAFIRSRLNQLRVVPANQLPQIADGENVRVAGIVLVRQRPETSKGVTFVTIEDETGPMNLLIWFDVWKKFSKVANTARGYLVHGRLQNQKDVIHVVVSKIEELPENLNDMRLRSRNFH